MKNRIIRFLQEYNIPFIERGKDVAKGNINICCPYCHQDTKFHLGINLTSGKYGCWRTKAHSSKFFYKLVVKLLGCSPTRAKNIVDDHEYKTNAIDYKSSIDKMFSIKHVKEKVAVDSLEFNKEFKIIENSGKLQIYWKYLYDRGFENPDKIIGRYNLLCAYYGDFKFRIIFPYYYQNKLVTWTSRTVTEVDDLRYKDLKVEKSIRPVKFCLYNYDTLKQIKDGSILYITEGVFDCLKILEHSPTIKCQATCLGTKSITSEQLELLDSLYDKYQKFIFLFDQDGKREAQNIVDDLIMFGSKVQVGKLPIGVKDPGDLTEYQVIDLVHRDIKNLF